MRIAFLGIVGVASGCGVLSGLDHLQVEDASIDATFEADASPPSDADASDTAMGSDASGGCDFQGMPLHCPSACASSCCVTSQELACNMACAGVALSCTTSEDCAASICCLEGVSNVDEACPTTISTLAGAHATCHSAPCVNGFKLCINDVVCSSGHCRLAVLTEDLDASLGICADF